MRLDCLFFFVHDEMICATMMKFSETPPTGEPDEGNPPVRFGERGWRHRHSCSYPFSNASLRFVVGRIMAGAAADRNALEGGTFGPGPSTVVSRNWLVFRCAQNGLGQGATREHSRSAL